MNATPPPAAPLGPPSPLSGHDRTSTKLEVNLRRNRQQDQTAIIDAAAAAFDYAACREQWWNDEEQSLLHGTPLWDEATADQRRVLNQLYWVAYYSQIISAEVATIYFNQTSAAALYGIEGFRTVCDVLDLESSQERAHIAAFKRIGDATEAALFGKRVFTWPMRGPFEPTMIFSDLGPFRAAMRRLELRAYGLLSAGSAFIGCQYFTVRGIRTLNGKMVQQKLSRYHHQQGAPEQSPIPTRISYSHFLDESFHFNSSAVIGTDLVTCLPKPTAFERHIANLTVTGCQRDHANVSVTVRGLFWDDTAAWDAVSKVLRSPTFGMSPSEAHEMIRRCYTEETDALHAAHKMQDDARAAYRRFVDGLDFLHADNRDMAILGRSTLARTLARHRRAFKSYRCHA